MTVRVSVCVCVPKQNKCTISCYWIPLLETLTTAALGGARQLGQILRHSKMVILILLQRSSL